MCSPKYLSFYISDHQVTQDISLCTWPNREKEKITLLFFAACPANHLAGMLIQY